MNDLRSCEHVLVYWSRVHSSPFASRKVVDAISGGTWVIVFEGADLSDGKDANKRLVHYWKQWCRLRAPRVAAELDAGKTASAMELERDCKGRPQATELSEKLDAHLLDRAITGAKKENSLSQIAQLVQARPRTADEAMRQVRWLGFKGRPSAELRNLETAFQRAGVADPQLLVLREQVDESRWRETLTGGPTPDGLRAYIQEFSSGRHASEAHTRVMDLAYKAALEKDGRAGLDAIAEYLKQFPDAPNAAEARAEALEREEQLALSSKSLQDHWLFLEKNPEVDDTRVRASIAELLVSNAAELAEEPYHRFVKQFPKAPETAGVRKALASVKKREERRRAAEALEEARERAEAAAARRRSPSAASAPVRMGPCTPRFGQSLQKCLDCCNAYGPGTDYSVMSYAAYVTCQSRCMSSVGVIQ